MSVQDREDRVQRGDAVCEEEIMDLKVDEWTLCQHGGSSPQYRKFAAFNVKFQEINVQTGFDIGVQRDHLDP